MILYVSVVQSLFKVAAETEIEGVQRALLNIYQDKEIRTKILNSDSIFELWSFTDFNYWVDGISFEDLT